MFPRQLVRLVQREEKLRRVRIPLAPVGHADQAATVESQSRVDLILEWLAVDAVPACTRPCRISSLHDEARDDAVEDDIVIVACGSSANDPMDREGIRLPESVVGNCGLPLVLPCPIALPEEVSLAVKQMGPRLTSMSPEVVSMMTLPFVAG